MPLSPSQTAVHAKCCCTSRGWLANSTSWMLESFDDYYFNGVALLPAPRRRIELAFAYDCATVC